MLPIHKLSIVIPFYNEEASLEGVVRSCLLLKGRLAEELELVLVDDHSTDASPAIAQRLARELPEVKLVRHEVNKGIGQSLKTGYANATGDWISIVPADGQFDPMALLPCAGLAEGADIICVCRKGRGDVTFYRRLISGANRLLNRILFGLDVRDVNWVKVYRAWTIHDITVRSTSPFVESERLALAKKAGTIKGSSESIQPIFWNKIYRGIMRTCPGSIMVDSNTMNRTLRVLERNLEKP